MIQCSNGTVTCRYCPNLDDGKSEDTMSDELNMSSVTADPAPGDGRQARRKKASQDPRQKSRTVIGIAAAVLVPA